MTLLPNGYLLSTWINNNKRSSPNPYNKRYPFVAAYPFFYTYRSQCFSFHIMVTCLQTENEESHDMGG